MILPDGEDKGSNWIERARLPVNVRKAPDGKKEQAAENQPQHGHSKFQKCLGSKNRCNKNR